MYQTFASRRVYPLFSPRIVSADASLWLSVGLHEVLRARGRCHLRAECTCKADSPLARVTNTSRLWEITDAWCARAISNYDYLLKLSQFAGERR